MFPVGVGRDGSIYNFFVIRDKVVALQLCNFHFLLSLVREFQNQDRITSTCLSIYLFLYSFSVRPLQQYTC